MEKQDHAVGQGLLADEERADLERIMTIKYAGSLGQRSFTLATQADAETVELTVTLQNSDASFYYPVEGRLAHTQQNLTARDAVLMMLDYIDLYFDEYFKEGSLLPIDWKDFAWEGVEMQLRGQIRNRKAEAQADKLLAEYHGAVGDAH